MAKESLRSIDTLSSSVDVLSLNNTVVSLRVPLKKTKIRVITKLVHQIRTYRKKSGSEEQTTSNRRKCDRLLKEIEEIKKLENDKVLKFALGNTKTLSDISCQNDLETKAMIRLSTHKLIATEVQKWRSQHSDWQSLAAFLIQHTSRRLRKKKRKVNDEADTGQNSEVVDGNPSVCINKTPAEELGSDDGDCNKKSANKKPGNISTTRDKKHVDQGSKVSSQLNTETDADVDKNINLVQTSGSEQITISVCDEEKKDDIQSGQLESRKLMKERCSDYICRGDVLVKRINLSELEHESESLDEERHIQFLFGGKEEGDKQRRALNAPDDEGGDDTTKGVKTKKKRDDFFLGGGSDTDVTSSSDNEMSTGLQDSLDDGEAAESKMSFAKKKMMVESTFLGCLSGGDSKLRRKNQKTDLLRKNSKYKTTHDSQKPHTKRNAANKNTKQMGVKSHTKARSRSGDIKNVVRTIKEAKKTSKTAEKGLHPSWEASLRKKQEQSVSLTRFEGKKIKFDD